MKLQLARTEGLNTFTAYGSGHVCVNGIAYSGNLVVLPDRLIHGWTQACFDTLCAADFDFLATLDAEIFLLGTGNCLRFPRPDLTQALMLSRKGLEVMDIAAVCRTYNVLINEGRRTAACLVFDPA